MKQSGAESRGSETRTLERLLMKDERDRALQETEGKESQRPRRCLSSLPQCLCCPAIIHLHIDLQQITGAV